MNKKKMAIVFGGRSSEHDVSCISVMTIIKADILPAQEAEEFEAQAGTAPAQA